MNVGEIQRRVERLDMLFESIEDDGEDFDEELAAVPYMALHAYLDFLARRDRTPYGKAFSELRAFVPELIDSYLAMASDDRRAVLDLLAAHPFASIALWSLLSEVRWRLRKAPPDQKPALLRFLLRIVVLIEEYLDEVETAMILTSAWGSVEESGIDPAPFFAAAAEVAGERPLTHGKTAREVLHGFEPYDYGRPVQG